MRERADITEKKVLVGDMVGTMSSWAKSKWEGDQAPSKESGRGGSQEGQLTLITLLYGAMQLYSS